MNADKALENIAETVTHCRFEATDPDSDEVVLMKILQVYSQNKRKNNLLGFAILYQFSLRMVIAK